MPVSPPRPKGPPLNALRAFESAARLGGFKSAAFELNVTPGAVAQHVKYLEQWCGAALFERHAKGVRLTRLGAAVLPDFKAAFDGLSLATQGLRVQAQPQQINIAALPSIAQLWLAPRLPKLRAALPDVRLSLTALEEPPNLAREPYDLAVFFEISARGDADFQFPKERLFPVCTPKLAGQLQAPSDLANFPCLFDLSWPEDWARWVAHLPLASRFTPNGPEFSLYSIAVQEALNGAGVLMGHSALLADLLGQGALVAPFAHSVPIEQYLTLETTQNNRVDGVLERVVDVLSQV